MQLNLLQTAIAPWPRRQAPLLVINCGNGDSLRLFWQSGFDLMATEFDRNLRKDAFARKIPQLELYAAKDDDLPFENDFFDWVVLHTRKDTDWDNALKEALRVGRRGIMITFWNKACLAALLDRLLPGKRTFPEHAVSWRLASRKMRALEAGRPHLLSTLIGPVFTWNFRMPLARLNSWFTRVPIGAWCIARLDLGRLSPFTPLPLRLAKQIPPQPVMEYAHKKISSTNPDKLL